MNLSQLLFMNGYGIYVWPTYIITLFVFGANVLSTLSEKKQIKRRIQQYLLQNQKS